jgi:hypothetical protein
MKCSTSVNQTKNKISKTRSKARILTMDLDMILQTMIARHLIEANFNLLKNYSIVAVSGMKRTAGRAHLDRIKAEAN